MRMKAEIIRETEGEHAGQLYGVAYTDGPDGQVYVEGPCSYDRNEAEVGLCRIIAEDIRLDWLEGDA